jgi:hypothetical protein
MTGGRILSSTKSNETMEADATMLCKPRHVFFSVLFCSVSQAPLLNFTHQERQEGRKKGRKKERKIGKQPLPGNP